MPALASINLPAVVVGAIINMVIGFLWYGPLFGEMWIRMMGKPREEIEAGAGTVTYLTTFLAALVSSFVLALVVRGFGASTLVQGSIAGAVTWIGIGATATLTSGLFEGRPSNVWLLFGTYQLIVYMILGALFALWS